MSGARVRAMKLVLRMKESAVSPEKRLNVILAVFLGLFVLV